MVHHIRSVSDLYNTPNMVRALVLEDTGGWQMLTHIPRLQQARDIVGGYQLDLLCCDQVDFDVMVGEQSDDAVRVGQDGRVGLDCRANSRWTYLMRRLGVWRVRDRDIRGNIIVQASNNNPLGDMDIQHFIDDFRLREMERGLFL